VKAETLRVHPSTQVQFLVDFTQQLRNNEAAEETDSDDVTGNLIDDVIDFLCIILNQNRV
jgi:hypothetical protein